VVQENCGRLQHPKVKFLFSLAIHNNCWTASHRNKRGLEECDLCALRHQAPGTMNHLLVDCVYTEEVWVRLRCAITIGQPAQVEQTAVDLFLEYAGELRIIVL
jgi:hypothetical protein